MAEKKSETSSFVVIVVIFFVVIFIVFGLSWYLGYPGLGSLGSINDPSNVVPKIPTEFIKGSINFPIVMKK